MVIAYPQHLSIHANDGERVVGNYEAGRVFNLRFWGLVHWGRPLTFKFALSSGNATLALSFTDYSNYLLVEYYVLRNKNIVGILISERRIKRIFPIGWAE